MKSIGFYIENANSEQKNLEIYKCLNNLSESKLLKDANLFFNNIDFMSIPPKFGMFDAHSLWNFTGILVCASLNNLLKAHNCVNKFKFCYLYDGSDKDLAGILFSSSFKVVTTTEEDQKEYYRLTGKKPVLLGKLEDILKEF